MEGSCNFRSSTKKSAVGTKSQSESSYPQEYYSMSTLNEDSTSSSCWSEPYEDKALNEHLYNSNMLRPDEGYSGHDREMLKRTMLGHEATFGKQVCELHHLYRRQKNMMDNHRRQEFYEFPLQKGTAQSYSFSSPKASESETTEKIWHIPHLSVSNDIKSSVDFLKETSVHSSQIPGQNGLSMKVDDLSNSKPEGFPRRNFDLQLPADVYINDNNLKKYIEKESIIGVKCESDVNLTLGTHENPVCFEGRKGVSIQSLPYLNESRIGVSCEEEAGSVCDRLLYGRINPEETHGFQLPMRSNRSFVTEDFFPDKHRDEGACSNDFNADKNETGQEWPPFTYEEGRSRNRMKSSNPNVNGEFRFSSESSKLTSERASYDHGHIHTWSEEKTKFDIGSYQKSLQFVDSNYSVLSNSQLIPYSELFQAIVPRRKSSKVTYVPIAIQALPCFPASELMNYRPRKMKGLNLKRKVAPSSKSKLKHNNNISVFEHSEGCSSQKHSKLRSIIKELRFDQSLGDCLPSQVKKSRKRKKKKSQDGSTKFFFGLPSTENPSQNATFIHSEDKALHEINLETISSLAAENLVAISLNLTDHFPRDSFDTLQWFANVVSSNSVPDHDGDENGVDLFQASTLKLEEVNPDEHLPPLQGLESQTDAKDRGMSLLRTKVRRGQAKKKLQKKDFKKDILPGLASLSKHEITEDFQAFDCIMRAMGESWENSVTKCDERKVMGWGRTTRRGRRPRVKASNSSLFMSPIDGVSMGIRTM